MIKYIEVSSPELGGHPRLIANFDDQSYSIVSRKGSSWAGTLAEVDSHAGAETVAASPIQALRESYICLSSSPEVAICKTTQRLPCPVKRKGWAKALCHEVIVTLRLVRNLDERTRQRAFGKLEAVLFTQEQEPKRAYLGLTWVLVDDKLLTGLPKPFADFYLFMKSFPFSNVMSHKIPSKLRVLLTD